MELDSDPSRCVVGLGSNVGDRRRHLAEARRLLGAQGVERGASSLWESDPVGGPVQGRFLNGAVSLEVSVEPEELLERLLEIERSRGRVRSERWGPRTLDLDLLWWGARRVGSGRLAIPHPRLSERAFALRPLLEVEPEATDPATGEPYRVVLARLREPLLERVAGPEDWLVPP